MFQDQDIATMDVGHKAELLLMDFFSKLDVAEVLTIKTDVHSKPVAIVKTTKEVDENEGIDFYLYHVGVGWVNVDLTISKMPDALNRKFRKGQVHNVMILQCSYQALWNAARGCEQDIWIITQRIRELFLEVKDNKNLKEIENHSTGGYID